VLFTNLSKGRSLGFCRESVYYESADDSLKSRWREKSWERKLRKSYGIKSEDYDRMLIEQSGVCFICGEPETKIVKGRLIKLAVDHCHGTGEIRGLLCHSCNVALGLLKDDSALLRKAADYIEGIK
jgi:hypothetical protein